MVFQVGSEPIRNNNRKAGNSMLDINLWTILFTVINLLVLFVAVKIFFFKPIKEIIEKRQQEVDKQYADAKETENAANSLKEQYEISMKDIEEEKIAKINDARAKASSEYDRIIGDAKNEADKIISDARKTAALEQEKTMKEAREQIVELVVEATAKVVASGQGQDADREIYNQFLAKTGETSE